MARGIICVRHKCVECCLETRMPLSNLDLKRILKLGYKLEYFAVKTDGGWRLKNNCGRCVFLIEESCGIHPHRPEGCRLYPLVYDENLRKAVIDPLCPYGHLFKIQRNDVKRLKILCKKLARTYNSYLLVCSKNSPTSKTNVCAHDIKSITRGNFLSVFTPHSFRVYSRFRIHISIVDSYGTFLP